MNNEIIFLPLIAHIFLVFTLYILLGKLKKIAVKANLVDRKQASIDANAWPENVIRVNNNLANQFESPVLFYALTFIYFQTNNINTWVLALFSFYAVTRYLHSYVHISSNFVPHRFKLFVLGMLSLVALALWLLFKLVLNI